MYVCEDMTHQIKNTVSFQQVIIWKFNREHYIPDMGKHLSICASILSTYFEAF